ncbi:MAG: hypothetical protein WBO46_27260 [Caldilineaceae bacterium]
MGGHIEINYANETKGSHTRNATLSTAVDIAVPVGAVQLIIQAETQNVRLTLDGTTPTATVGFLLTAGATVYTFPVAYGMTVKIIQTTATAVVNYQFVKV